MIASASESALSAALSSSSAALIASFRLATSAISVCARALVLLRLGLADLLGRRVAAGLRVLRLPHGRLRAASSAISSPAAGAAPRFARARSSTSGFSRIHLMSSISTPDPAICGRPA
jgi:hypothetical protein